MVFEDFKCEICDYSIEKTAERGDKLPKSIICTECGGTAYRMWGANSILIPSDFRAVDEDSGRNQVKRRMKKYNGLRPAGEKRFY